MINFNLYTVTLFKQNGAVIFPAWPSVSYNGSMKSGDSRGRCMSFSPRLGRNLLIEWCVWRCVSLKALPTHTAPFPRPHPSFVCTGFTPTSFNICFACTIKLCHRQKRENLKGSRAEPPALPPPPPPPPAPHWGKAERGLSRKPLLFFFIYLWVTEKGAVVITTPVFFPPVPPIRGVQT